MKKTIIIATILSTISLTSNATLWRVNNTPGVSANFTDLPAAVTAAATGDTIYVEPSTAATYGGVTINKKLTIIGNGHFVSTNYNFYTVNPGLQANMTSSAISAIVFDPGSENSTLMGCLITGNVTCRTSNLNIKRNFIGGYLYLSNYQSGVYVNMTNIDIRQNIIYVGLTTNQFSTNGGAVGITNVNIQNNILSAYYYFTFSLPIGISGFIMNNAIYTPYAYMDVSNFQVNNNVMVGGSLYPNNNVYFNNIGIGTQFGNTNGNQQNISMTTLFLNYGTGATDSSYILNPAGPGIGTGFSGVNVGPYGGPDPYRKSGIPPVPSIYLLSAPATTTTSTLPVTISTRSND